MLGPPKTAFASASGARNGNKALDPLNRTTHGPIDEEAVRNDRLGPHERPSKDGNLDKDGDKPRETRLGNLHNRKSTKEDNESWSGSRQQKVFSHDDAERSNRRHGDRDKEKDEVRELRHQRGFENHRRDAEREHHGDPSGRRNVPGRGRFEPSWHREDDRQDREPQESSKDTSKPRDWRDKDKGGTRGLDREWVKTAKPEQDPEWLAEPEPEEKKWAHTQEDFQRWKERMKATNGPNQDLPQSPEQRPNHERATSNISLTAGKVKIETPLLVDPNFDGFFGLWSESNKDQSAQDPANNNVNKANASKPSKFTGFFSSKIIPEAQESEPSLPHQPLETSKDSSNEDKEGFQRILKLLAGNETQSREKAPQDVPLSQPAHALRTHEPNALESLLGSQHPKDAPIPQNKDSEFLLKLMQQTQQTRPNPSSSNNQRQDGGPAAGLRFSNLRNSPRDPNQQTPGAGPPPGFFNDMPREDLQHRDRLNPTASERKGQPPGFFGGFSPEIIQRTSGGVGINQPSLPSALQRPPGLDPTPPTYVQNLQPQRQHGMVPPPPGFQAALRAHNPFPPGLIPNLSNSNNLNERGPPYGPRPVGSTGPTGMPPPGFINMNPQPPGFPLTHFNQDGRISPPSRLYYGGPGSLQQGIDGYGDQASNSFGLGGQGILPGQYRRQE